MSQQLLDYIKQARASGQSDDQIKDACLKAGWPENVIAEALGGKITAAPPTAKVSQRVKCAHCGHIGPGLSGRSTWAQVLAWMAIIFTPTLTILYYLFTNPWLCAQCGSKLVEEIDEQGRVKKRRKAVLIILLIALIVVPIIIIGFLASTVLVSLGGARERARDARRIADLRQTQTALDFYYDKYQAYPQGMGSFEDTLDELVTEKFFGSLPQDPGEFGQYFYCASADRQAYVVGAKLENKNSSVLKNDLDGDQYCSSASGACDDPVYCVTELKTPQRRGKSQLPQSPQPPQPSPS